MFSSFSLVSLLASCVWYLPLQALVLTDPEEVEYFNFNVTARLGASVRLDCGADPPAVFIWGFTKAGSDGSVALACDYGRGPELRVRPDGVLRVRVPANGSALVMDEVRREAAGTYTCQALYDEGHAARVMFYSTQLDVEDD